MFVLDTNVISEIRRGRKAHPKVIAWSAATPSDDTYLSVITILEIEVGTQLMERRDAARGRLFRDWIVRTIMPSFAGRIIDIDTAVAQCCAGLHVPTTRPQRDTFIAATAIVHGMTVVTRNVGDFQMPGVRTLNPWI
jgi:predicted nucleic acid-binding protein